MNFTTSLVTLLVLASGASGFAPPQSSSSSSAKNTRIKRTNTCHGIIPSSAFSPAFNGIMQVPLRMASESAEEIKDAKEEEKSTKAEKSAEAPVATKTKTKTEEPAPEAKKIDIEPTSSGSAAAAVAVAPPTAGKMGKKMDERIFNLNKQIIDRVYDLICFFYPVKVIRLFVDEFYAADN